MAGNDQGRREVVNDPLAITGREQAPDRSLALQGIRPPNIGDPTGAFGKQAAGYQSALEGLQGVLGGILEKKRDDLIVEGKVMQMSGVTEAEMQKNGNKYTQQGYNTLAARDTVNNWFTKESVAIAEAGKTMPPEEYQKFIAEKRKSVLDGITDPDARKVAVAAFEDINPRLAQSQIVKNSEYNKEQRVTKFAETIGGVAQTSGSRSVTAPDGTVRMTPQPIGPVITSSAEERDIGIRTLLGEAGGEGTDGMAAVAHVLKNRAVDKSGRFPNSIAGVAKEPKQFSVWNDGAIPAAAMTPDHPMYQKAGRIYDAVMSGRTVDLTGGATHYYSPEGMKAQGKEKPDWYDAEAAKAGGSIKIGGHVFAGKAGSGFNGTGKIEFRDPSQDKLQAPFKSALSDTSAALGMPLRILSGHRGEDHPVEKAKMFAGYSAGEHSTGSAADIDMSGMNDQQRTQLIRELRSRGVLRFGTYTNMPNMLHVDTKDQNKDGQSWFMHDKTNSKMAAAPAWFKQAAGEPVGKITAQPAQSGTEVQNTIRGYAGLDGPDKAKAVADAMRRKLAAGDDSLFNDGGGVAMLYELKASPSDIDEVIKAKAAFDHKRTTEFNAGREQWRADFLGRVERGELNTASAIGEIEKQHKLKMLDDTSAKALAHAATDKIRALNTGNTKLDNPDMLQEIGVLYQKIQTGADFVESANEAKKIGTKYGATDTDIKTIVGHMFALDQGYKTKLRSEAEALVAERERRTMLTNQVDRALAQGYGLGLIHGEKLEVTNDHGQKAKVSVQEYGVMRIKDKWAKQYTDQVNSGRMTPGEAKAEIIRKTFLELQQHGVVDTQTQAQITAGLSGNILGADGKLKPGATQAYDAYLTLKTTPNIKDGYLAKTVSDPYVRGLLETAFMLDAGDMNRDQALMKAHEIMNDPNRNPEDKVSKDVVWREKLSTSVKNTLNAKARSGFWEGLFYDDSEYDASQLTKRTALAEAYVTQRAEAYHLQHPNEHANVSLEKGIQDLQNNSTALAGNLIITKPGFELHKVMGVSGHGPQAADKAMKDFLATHGEILWPGGSSNSASYAGQREGFAKAAVRGLSDRINSDFPQGMLPPMARRDPPVSITYNPDMGVVSIDLITDEATGKTLGNVKHIPVKMIGDAYNKKMTTPGFMAKTWDSMFSATMAPSAPKQ
jgi:spore germination cell wall hydrolase CwlJ-like protein